MVLKRWADMLAFKYINLLLACCIAPYKKFKIVGIALKKHKQRGFTGRVLLGTPICPLVQNDTVL
jgi:hypothetical protein